MMTFTSNSRNKRENLLGKSFGLLTVVGPARHIELDCEVRSAWQVECKCGEKFDVVSRYLKRGKVHCGKSSCRSLLEEQNRTNFSHN